MKKKHLFHAFVIVTLGSLLFGSLVCAQSSESHVTFVRDRAKSPYGHIIVRIAPDRKAPKDWEMQWYVSIYTPKDHKLPLGYIFDAEPLRDSYRLVFEVPIGDHKIEITRRSLQWAEGGTKAFYIDEGIWRHVWPEIIKVDNIVAPVRKGDIKIVNIDYENAQVSEGEGKGNKEITLYTWEQFKLSVENGSPADLPEEEPELYSIVQHAEFEKIDQIHFVEALKKSEDFRATVAFFNCEKPNARLISQALTDKSLKLNMSVARILEKAGDNSAVKPLIDFLKEDSEDEPYIAAWTLGKLRAREAVDPLIGALDDRSVLLRNHAAYALAQIKDERAVDALIKATEDTDRFNGQSMYFTDPEIYITICFTKEDGVIGPDLPYPYSQVRDNAIYALGQIGGKKAVNKLLNLIDETDGNHVPIIFALSNHKDSRVIDALIKELKSKHQVSQWSAIQALGRMKAKKALVLLEDIAKNNSDETVRKAALEALEKIEKADEDEPAGEVEADAAGNKVLITGQLVKKDSSPFPSGHVIVHESKDGNAIFKVGEGGTWLNPG